MKATMPLIRMALTMKATMQPIRQALTMKATMQDHTWVQITSNSWRILRQLLLVVIPWGLDIRKRHMKVVNHMGVSLDFDSGVSCNGLRIPYFIHF